MDCWSVCFRQHIPRLHGRARLQAGLAACLNLYPQRTQSETSANRAVKPGCPFQDCMIKPLAHQNAVTSSGNPQKARRRVECLAFSERLRVFQRQSIFMVGIRIL